jgi:threonine/homoserine/homoserine lactone efflux protein
MKGIIKIFFASLLSQDMAKQARQVEILTVIVFVILLVVVWWLWNFQINITVPSDGGREVVATVNIFELLLSKK